MVVVDAVVAVAEVEEVVEEVSVEVEGVEEGVEVEVEEEEEHARPSIWSKCRRPKRQGRASESRVESRCRRSDRWQ